MNVQITKMKKELLKLSKFTYSIEKIQLDLKFYADVKMEV